MEVGKSAHGLAVNPASALRLLCPASLYRLDRFRLVLRYRLHPSAFCHIRLARHRRLYFQSFPRFYNSVYRDSNHKALIKLRRGYVYPAAQACCVCRRFAINPATLSAGLISEAACIYGPLGGLSHQVNNSMMPG